jgi:hypothetical protein
MRWRIMLELAGSDGTSQRHEVGSGERIPTEHTAATLGLGLEESKGSVKNLGRYAASRLGAWIRKRDG